MRLGDHLRETKQTDTEFAERITARLRIEDPTRRPVRAYTVSRYRLPPGHKDHRIPAPDIMRAIGAETGGVVQPNDFYDLSSAPRPPARTGGGGKGNRSSAAAPVDPKRTAMLRERNRKSARSRQMMRLARAGAPL